MKNSKQKKHMISGKTKEEKRRLAFEKRNAKRERNVVRYGAEGGSALVMAKTADFNRRFVAAFLALVFAISCMVVGVNFATKAEDNNDFEMLESSDDNGLVLRKGLKDNGDGTYDLKMEAYATKNLAQKTLDDKTPLDIVMVLQEGTSMAEQDVLQGYNASSATSFSINDAKTKYYLDDGVYYPLSVDNNVYFPISDSNGELIGTWTAQSANQWKLANTGNRGLYYLVSDNNYEEISITKENWYKLIDEDIKIYANFTKNLDWYATTQWNKLSYAESASTPSSAPHSVGATFYAYQETDHTWHSVYVNHSGTIPGFEVTLYYYTKSNTGSSVRNSSTWSNAKRDGLVTILGQGEEKYWWSWGESTSPSYGTDNYYRARDLYFDQGISSTYNKMATTSTVVAYPKPDSQVSETYTGSLYTKGYQLYYTKNGQRQYVGDAVMNETDIAVTNDTLYEEDNITRQAALKSAANQFAEQIAEDAATSNIDHRIAVIGYATNGDIKSGLVSAKEDDSDDENHVNDAVDSAINGLGSSGGNNITAGLNSAKAAFDASTIDSSNRKRIVVVFADASVSSSSDALAEANSLKDTYNASVYTVGLNNNNEDFLRKVSSEYFYTQQTNNGTYYYRAKDAYSDTTGVPVSGIEPLADAFSAVFGALKPASITTTLDATNAMLKDVISANFNTETIISTTVQTAESQYSDGTLSWKTAQNAGLTPAWGEDRKTLTVEGFDYSANYVNYETENHPGKKIIVTISNLTLSDKVNAEANRRVYSNTAASGIYKTGTEETLYGAFPRPFVDETSTMVPAGSSGKPDATSGIVVNKYLTAKENGKYDLTVETYTTKTSTEVKEKVPTDFIVVADQSGSMSTQDMATAYTSASDAYLETIATSSNGYYYYDSDTGNYYRVYPVKGYLYQYYAANTKWAQDVIEEGGMDLSWFQGSTDATYSVANQYYYKTSDGVYRPVGVSATGKLGTYYVKLHYTDANGDTVYFVRPTYPVYKNVFGSGKYQYGDLGYRAINAAVTDVYSDPEAYTYSEFLGITTGMYINYPMYKRRVGYTELRYRDVNGVEHTVPAKNGSTTWEYCNSSKQALTTASGSTRPTYSGLYQASNKITRLEALQNALTNFVTAVANEKDDVNDPVGNRIAIVGFSSDGYNNTELLTGENLDISGTDGTQKTTADADARAHYGTALVDATDGDTGSVNPKITEAINALTASGGTQPEDGLDMAYKILTNRSQKTYTVQSSGNDETIDRNVFVIYFTDGQPGDYPFSNMYTEANDVVEKAKLIKDYRVEDNNVAADRVIIPSLFSIGVFGESDGNPLTYAAHRENSLKTAYEYEPGWMETFDANNYSTSATGGYRYQYLNRNWLPSDEANYGTTPNDTIYDYMSVVSSNYPNATKFMNVKSSNTAGAGEADTTGYTNYLGMVSGVRGDSIGSNRYYRMASNQDTLVGAFEQAVTMTNQTISSNQRLDSSSIMRDIFDDNNFKTSTDTTAKTHTVDGSMDKNGIVNFDESTRTSINLPATIGTVNGKTTVDVTGFDYLENYINYGTGTGASYIPQNNGKKLVLTITNIEPKAGVVSTNAAPLVYSNDVASAMYVNNTNKVNNTEFPTPAITRHRYTLDVGEVNTSATFDVAVKILDSDEEVVAKDDDMLEDVMLVYPDGTRAKYSEVGGQTFLAMKNGESFYLENLPPDTCENLPPDTCRVQTEVTATDDAYNYSIYYDSDASTNAESMKKGEARTHIFSYTDSTIHIISTRGSKAVTIREETTGSYGDLTRVFDEIITMDMPVISETQNKPEFSFNCTFNDDYSSFDDDLPKNADSYTAVFGKVTQDDGTISTKLIRIDSVKGNDTYSKTITDGKFPMKHDDVMTLTNVPSGNTVKVQEADSFDHDLFYYYGQDNISPSDIRLKTTTGSLMKGTHTFTLRPVDGTDGSDLTLTFVDGVVTNPSAEIDLGLYQRASVVNDDMSEAVLDIAGTTFTFDTETSDANIAYVTTIKQLAYDPPVQVTVDKTDMDILVVNRIGDIAVTGIFDDSQHNWVIYVLAGIAILSAGAGAAYVYRRKRLTTER